MSLVVNAFPTSCRSLSSNAAKFPNFQNVAHSVVNLAFGSCTNELKPLKLISRAPLQFKTVQRRGRQFFLKTCALSASSADAAIVGEEDSKMDEKDANDILMILEKLRESRGMSVRETRLTIMIEDPREIERRRQMGIEDERGCSREEMAEALVEVYEGRMPKDRLVLRNLAEEMRNWPNLDLGEGTEGASSETASPRTSPYAQITNTGVTASLPPSPAIPSPSKTTKKSERETVWDAAAEEEEGEREEKKDLSDILPNWVGYGFLYSLSILPVLIGITVLVVLFLNSLQ